MTLEKTNDPCFKELQGVKIRKKPQKFLSDLLSLDCDKIQKIYEIETKSEK